MKKLFVIAIAALLFSCGEEKVVVHVKVKGIKSNVTRVLPLENGDFYAQGDTIVLNDCSLDAKPDTVTITQIYEE